MSDTTSFEAKSNVYTLAFNSKKDLDPESYREAFVPLSMRKLKRQIAQLDEKLIKFSDIPFSVPTFIEGCCLLLVNGAQGEDIYLAALSVGETGKVLVCDPSKERLEKARQFIQQAPIPQGLNKAQVEFFLATGEQLPFPDESIDSIAFNPYFNAAVDKGVLLKEALRVLVPGGELYVATLFSSRRLSPSLASQSAMLDSLLGGCLYIEDFRRTLANLGIHCFRYMDQHLISAEPLLKTLAREHHKELKMTAFSYRVVRTFKIYEFEDLCEKYGQVLTYKGNAPGCEQYIDINDTHRFYTGDPLGVCGNTAAYVEKTRLKKYFDCEGTTDFHEGVYDYCLYCGTEIGESSKLSNMAKHLANLDLARQRVDSEVSGNKDTTANIATRFSCDSLKSDGVGCGSCGC